MEGDTRRVNKLNFLGQGVYVFMLFGMFLGNYLIGSIPIYILLGFVFLLLVSYGLSFFLYYKNRSSERLKYFFGASFSLIYFYTMLVGTSEFRFALLFPPLCLMILYHSFKLMRGISITAAAINIINVVVCIFVFNRSNMDYVARYIIQMISVLGSSAFAMGAAEIYDRSYKQNLRYYKRVEQMSLQTIETVANTIDAKDAYTQGHSRRVSEYSALIAKRLGFSDEEVENVRYVALLHDVGKIAVPDIVLNKPAKLTNEEYNLMKIHTTEGAEILKSINTMQDISHGARYHHERVDGKGYPEGLKGEDIPLVARIIGLADAYDAMTSTRVYRKPLSKDAVINEILRGRGTQFDEDCVDAFLDYLDNEDYWEVSSKEEVASVKPEIRGKHVEHHMADRTDVTKYDPLTGAYNREYGMDVLRDKTFNGHGALLLFNIVGLSNINMEYGYKAGDYYLENVCETIIKNNRNPVVMRHNGNEFLAYVEIKDKNEVASLARAILREVEALEEKDPLMEKSIDMTCAATMVGDRMKSLEAHILDLEKVLYLLKGSGEALAFFEAKGSKRVESSGDRDLDMLVAAISEESTENIYTAMGDKDFDRMISLLKEHPGDSFAFMLFTVKPGMDDHGAMADLSGAVYMLEEAMGMSIQETGFVSYYSALQRVVVLYSSGKGEKSWEEYMDDINKEILSAFHKGYGRNDVEITCNTEIVNL